ncbi:28S ribosomal protein S18c, mitochondrial [Caerostris darwini]|uniref:28S ribosomal protein S18c, mitochondrial n=1 Tax=Caerostris darwini TaxID=1538125 RepID=A0AAV4UZB9_9ARAC|nr:28S ribosomal protein S18c, mitochondrial [Caerostris darwini]
MSLLRNALFTHRNNINLFKSKIHFPKLNACSISMRNSSTCNTEEDKNLKTEENKDMFISDIDNPFERKERVCILCKYKIPLDYKNPRLLSQFISSYTGMIYEKNITGLCETQQKHLVATIKTARKLGYMHNLIKEGQYLKDPKLFDPFSPSRPNPH